MKYFSFDIDGVLIICPYLTDNLHHDYGVSKKESLEFIFGEYQDCVLGKKDLKKILPKYLESWNIDLSVDEFLKYWFDKENAPNQELIDYIQQLRELGHHVSVSTNQEKYRIKYIREDMNFDQYFDRIFTASEIGYKKPNPKYYEHVTEQLGEDPSNIYFFEDRVEYVKSAKGVGWNAFQYKSNKQTIKVLENLK